MQPFIAHLVEQIYYMHGSNDSFLAIIYERNLHTSYQQLLITCKAFILKASMTRYVLCFSMQPVSLHRLTLSVHRLTLSVLTDSFGSLNESTISMQAEFLNGKAFSIKAGTLNRHKVSLHTIKNIFSCDWFVII